MKLRIRDKNLSYKKSVLRRISYYFLLFFFYIIGIQILLGCSRDQWRQFFHWSAITLLHHSRSKQCAMWYNLL